MRTVYYVPTIHSVTEAGEETIDDTRRIFGKKAVIKTAKENTRIWRKTVRRIRARIRSGAIDPKSLFIFVDSLTQLDGIKFRDLLKYLYSSNIRIMRFIGSLAARGATVCPTEKRELMLIVDAFLGNGDPELIAVINGIPKRKRDYYFDKLRVKRDLAVARNIDRLLPKDAVALVFMGSAHDVPGQLKLIAPGIRVHFVVSREECDAILPSA